MKKEYFFTGKTTDIALENAMAELNISEDEISYEVDKFPVKGFLGIGGNAARIKVTVEDNTPEPVVKQTTLAPEKTVQKSKSTAQISKKPTNAKKEPSKPKTTAELETFDAKNIDIEDLKSHISNLLKHMKAENVEINIAIVDNEVHVNINGSDAGLLIGKHGDTLDAISYYTNLYLNRKTNSRIRLILDIENYRLKRKEILEALANKMAKNVITNNRNVTLEPMQAYERRIIHSVLQDIEGITTYSVGNDPYRKIVIALKKNN